MYIYYIVEKLLEKVSGIVIIPDEDVTPKTNEKITEIPEEILPEKIPSNSEISPNLWLEIDEEDEKNLMEVLAKHMKKEEVKKRKKRKTTKKSRKTKKIRRNSTEKIRINEKRIGNCTRTSFQRA